MAKFESNISTKDIKKQLPWELCHFCPMQSFKSSSDFVKHLRDRHCTKEGGSYVCRYGFNGVCASLPLDGVSDRDYETHVSRYHVNQVNREPEWSVFSAAQNLPAVLNDPSKGKQTNLFTKKWGDSFVEKAHIHPSSYLQVVEWDDFDSYLKKVGKRYRKHVRISTTMSPSASLSLSTQLSLNSPNESPSILSPRRASHPLLNEDSSKSSELTNNSIENDSILAARISAINTSSVAKSDISYGDLSEIPQIFMDPSFDLNNPSTFTQVFPGVCDSSEESKSAARQLQEKLSHYLDIVELQISRQVSEKSSAFFHAMTSQDAIMEEMNETAVNVKECRSKLKSIDETIVKDSLKILQFARRRQNYLEILEKLKLMATVHQTQPMIQLLLGTQDYVAALDLIGTTQEIVAQELIGIHCFRHLPSQLKEMERLIDKMLVTEFERFSTADLNRPLNEGILNHVQEEDKLVSIVMGLLREKNFSFIDTYKEETIDTIKAIIKEMVIEIIASSDKEVCLTGAGEEAQRLSISEWIQLLRKATIALMKVLHRIKLVHDVMLQTTDASAGKIGNLVNFVDSEAFLSKKDHETMLEKLDDLLKTVCNYCHERCANLISSQSLEESVATIDEIEELTKIIDDFSRNCEKICGNESIPLKAALNVQASRFAQKFHSERKSKLSLLLDSERWKQVDIPNEFQKMIDRISSNDFNFKRFEEFSSSSPTSPVLLVDDKPYTLVGAALLLVQIVSEYCHTAIKLPICGGYLSRHVMDLLRTFNSRSCQLVLGAGALHVAGLKTITSSNLALVSRALQLVLWVIPKVKSHFQLIDANSVQGYDIVEKDIVGHIKEIEMKIPVIINNLIGTQLSQWDARPPIPSQSFRHISRHYVKLHEAISAILPERQVHSIYRVVHHNFKHRLREQLLKYNIINNGGPQHGTVTSELTFYMETLRTLKALPEKELTDESLEDIWLK